MNGRAGIALIALKELGLEMHNRLEVPGLSNGGASRRERVFQFLQTGSTMLTVQLIQSSTFVSGRQLIDESAPAWPEVIRRGRPSTSEVSKNILCLRIEQDCHSGVVVMPHRLVNGRG